MSAHENRLRRGHALREDAARAAGNKNLSLPPGWRLDKDGFPVKGGGKRDTMTQLPRRAS